MLTKETAIVGEGVTGVAATLDECWIQAGPYDHPNYKLTNVFTLLAEKGINVDIVNQSEEQNALKLSFTVAQADEEAACKALKEQYPNLNIQSRNDVSKISIVGVGMRTHAGVAARMFRTLTKEKIDIFLVTTSEIKVGCLILREHVNKAVNILHDEFISRTPD